MKKGIVILIAALALVSCAEESVLTPGTGSNGVAGIGFAANLDKGGFTRAEAIDSHHDIAAQGGFDAWIFSHYGNWGAWIDHNLIIDNTGNGYTYVQSPDGGVSWSYGTPRFWPENRNVSCFAVAPHEAWESAGWEEGVPLVEYSITADTGAEHDLMIANARHDLTPTTTGSGTTGMIPLTFRHALSRIKVEAFTSASSDVVVLRSIELRGLRYTGNAPLDFELRGASLWSLADDVTDYGLSAANGARLTGSPTLLSPESMLLMPQPLAMARIAVAYTVEGWEFSWEGEFPGPAAWEPGHSYRYKLDIGADLVTITCGELEAPENGNWGEY